MEQGFDRLAKRYVDACKASGYSTTVIRLSTKVAAGFADMDDALRRYAELAEGGMSESAFAKAVASEASA